MVYIGGVPEIAISYSRFSSPKQADGDSLKRQLEAARSYAAQNSLTLDETQFIDKGRSAFHGRNADDGILGTLIKRAKHNQLNGAKHLLIESPDRLSREIFSVAFPKVYQPLLNTGLILHFINIRDILKPDHTFMDLLRVGCAMDVGNRESAQKSERCGASWKRKRQSANGKAAMSARVPAWLKAEKGKPIEVRPERAAIVKQIFEWAAKGLGAYLICDKLIKAGAEPWGKVRKGKSPRWTPFYVSDILRNRATIGEYAPHAIHHVDGRKKRVAEGQSVANYYPAVIPSSLFQRVQEARRAFAHVRFGEEMNVGKDFHSDRNLFKKLIWDQVNDAPMVYRHGSHPYLVSTHRQNLKQHKTSYALFERLMLKFLSEADWQMIAQEGQCTECLELTAQLECVAHEIDDNEKVLKRYEQIIDDPHSKDFERIRSKYRMAVAKAETLQANRKRLESQRASQSVGEQILRRTKGFETDSHSKESRMKLRLFLAERILRIDFVFGTGGLVVYVRFVNGADRMIDFRHIEPVLAWQRSWERGRLK